ncbi:MAG TPA: cellulase family glycosylhydrolase [Candidatus Paceibacterota bacterium]|nr:cellulase family glycosylhydrolase [Verrucomicrobiota bacterium]HSA12421.1 cellulase family glycosylhydrolase [Candidatus Paceibacterota bacterium]
MKLKVCGLMALLPLLVGAAGIPEPVLPAGVGVNIHFVTGHETDLDLIAAAGFRFVRMDFHWGAIEPRKGEYNWAGYEELLANLEKRGLRAILILDYSHSLYEEEVACPHPITGQPHKTTASPQHPESVAAFARWAAAAARHFRGRPVLWEIWNEPNGHFWSPKPDVQQYTTLALATAKAMREADPRVTIIGPASAGFPWEFLEAFFKSGVLEHLDAVSVHPYRDPKQPPETATGDFQKLRALIDSCAPPARKDRMPILSGEWGYSTHKKGVSLETQAAFAARQQLSNLLNGVPLSIWYDWKNDGPDPNENEHNFGTVMPDLAPKPAYVAIKTLTRELSGYRIARRLTLASDKDYALLCTNQAGDQKLAAWTLEEEHPVSIPLRLKGDTSPTAVNRNDETLAPRYQAGNLVLNLSSEPQYVTLGKAAIK